MSSSSGVPEPEAEPEQDASELHQQRVVVDDNPVGATLPTQQPGSAAYHGSGPKREVESFAAPVNARAVAVVGNPSFIGIPIPQALFHPPPNGSIACYAITYGPAGHSFVCLVSS